MIFQKFKDMVIGYTNLLKKKANVADQEIEELAKMRYSVCLKCPENKGETCGACGCVLAAKVRALETNCPKMKW